jgi:hypothetical protein
VSGKKPSDAVQAVYALHDQVNVLRKQKGLKRIGRYARKDGKVTPAIVFINAGIALDGLAQISQRIDSTKKLRRFIRGAGTQRKNTERCLRHYESLSQNSCGAHGEAGQGGVELKI